MIYFLTGYVAFEEFLLKFLPVSDTIYSYLRFFGEIIIYIAFGKLVIHKLHRGIPFVKTAIDVPVIGFYSVVLLSMLINRSPLIGSIYNIRPFARYIVLFYLIANSALSERRNYNPFAHNSWGWSLPTCRGYRSVGGRTRRLRFLPASRNNTHPSGGSPKSTDCLNSAERLAASTELWEIP